MCNRNFYILALVGLGILSLTPALLAQCLQPAYTQATCSTPGCQQTVTIVIPRSSEYGYSTSAPTEVPCCNTYLTAYVVTGNCVPRAIRSAAIQQEIKSLNRTQPILIADCEGQYSPMIQGVSHLGTAGGVWTASSHPPLSGFVFKK